MPTYEITAPDGKKLRITAPEGASENEVLSYAQANYKPKAQEQLESTGFNAEAAKDTVVDVVKNIAGGALSGASKIGATIAAPFDYISDKITGKTDLSLSNLVSGTKPKTSNEERRAALEQFFKEKVSPDSNAFKVGELGSEVAGTAGVGGVLAKGIKTAGAAMPFLAQYAPKLAAAVESGGFTLGTPAATTIAGKAADLATRVAGGSIVGGASAGLVDPKDAGMGAVLGGALPLAVIGGAAAGRAVRNAVMPEVAPEVAGLYQKAKAHGIDIPADRLVDSKALNATAASLNYVPLSGRTGTEKRMVEQFDRAVSRTFGQDDKNVVAALKRADLDLGTKFERTLSQNSVAVDNQLLNDMVSVQGKAVSELSESEARIIGNQIDEIMDKAKNGILDGQAAYNIKKTLDRIGKRNSNEAFYALDLKKSLMDALDRSLGPVEAAKFKTLRQQYGNMLDVEGLVRRGAEGGVSIAKLAGDRNIKNADLSELADIAGQFLKTREGPHGAAQRVGLAAMAATAFQNPGTIPLMVGGVAGARGANIALNSDMMKNALLRGPGVPASFNALANPVNRSLLYNAGQ